jgi:hypothetical protein
MTKRKRFTPYSFSFFLLLTSYILPLLTSYLLPLQRASRQARGEVFEGVDFMALESFLEPAIVQNWANAWTDGRPIRVGFIMNKSSEAVYAGGRRISGTHTLVMRPESNLTSRDVVKRVRDGALYRIISDLDASPDVSSERIVQAQAEKMAGET